MISLVRQGCQSMIVETDDPVRFEKEVLRAFDYANSDFKTAFDTSDGTRIIVMLTRMIKTNNSSKEMDRIYSVGSDAASFLCFLLNLENEGVFRSVRLSPKVILLRLMGDVCRAINRIESHFGAERGSFETLLDEKGAGTLIAFTEKSLQKSISISDMHPVSLFTESSSPSILGHMGIHSLEYLNLCLHNRDWNELDIKIYDSYGNFELHYRRLLFIVEALEAGLILGESWGRDTASVFQSVGIYRVRLFTFLPPVEIKKMLTGLEYLENGKRIVDMDLYAQKNKIRWTELRTPELKDKTELGKMCHKMLVDKLSSEQNNRFASLNAQAK